jgi:hypothetical protein
VRAIEALKSKRSDYDKVYRWRSFDCPRHGRRSHAHNACGQCAPTLCAGKSAQQLCRRNLWPVLSAQHRLAALHVAHAAHAATVFTTEAERDTRERAAKQHEQKEQRCKTALHLPASHCRKRFNQSQYSFTATNCRGYFGNQRACGFCSGFLPTFDAVMCKAAWQSAENFPRVRPITCRRSHWLTPPARVKASQIQSRRKRLHLVVAPSAESRLTVRCLFSQSRQQVRPRRLVECAAP